MALEISYWSGYDPVTRTVYGELIASATQTLGSSSTDCGTPPANAAVARLTAGENCRISNNGASATATNGVLLNAGDSIDLQVPRGGAKLKGMTV